MPSTPPAWQPTLPPAISGIPFPKLPLPGPSTPGDTHPGAPPARGSRVESAELAAIRLIQRARTPERDAWAREMAAKGGMNVWRQPLCDFTDAHGKLRGAQAGGLVAAAMGATALVTAQAKNTYDRERPYKIDDRIVSVVGDPKGASYPSGHSSSAFAAARIMARLEPSKAASYYDLASQVALSRVYAGVHFPTDVIAGALLGTGVAEVVLRSFMKPNEQ